MNHYVAMQPPHLAGLWQYAMLNSRGGGPICGCTSDQGHDTSEGAERHLYDTVIDNMVAPHTWADPELLQRCERCSEWTDARLMVQVHHFDHAGVHVMCPVCAAPFTAENWRAAVRELVPFRPGAESWGTI